MQNIHNSLLHSASVVTNTQGDLFLIHENVDVFLFFFF